MAVIGLDSVVFTAPDMARARAYFTDWGLRKVSSGKAGAVFETEIGSRIILRPRGAKNLPPVAAKGMNYREMIWGVGSKRELARLAREIATDREVTEDSDGTIHCLDPNGLGLGFRVWKHTRNFRPRRTPVNITGKIERVDKRSTIFERARPLRMGHIGFVIPDLKAAEKFYHDRLGFPVSDRYAGGAALFLRCAPENEHHNLFLIWSKDGATRFDHIAFEVRDIHEVFGGGLYFDRHGWKTRVGPGRHPVSSAYFWYFNGPCDGAMEYYCDSDWVTPDWKPSNFRNNRFSEWHMVDGIRQVDDGRVRRSAATAGRTNF